VDTGRKRRRRRTSPSVYGSVPPASRALRGSRRRGGLTSGGDRPRWNRRRLSQKSPPTLESHVTAGVGGLGGGNEGDGKDSGVAKSSRSKHVVSREEEEGLFLRKRLSDGREDEDTSNEFDDVKLISISVISAEATPGGVDVHSRNEADDDISECHTEKQQCESSSGSHAKSPPFTSRPNKPCESPTKSGLITTKKADIDDGGRKRGSTNVSSAEVTPDKQAGSGHVRSATTEGKIVTPPEKGKQKRLKKLGDIVAKLRTETEKSLQMDAN